MCEVLKHNLNESPNSAGGLHWYVIWGEVVNIEKIGIKFFYKKFVLFFS